MLEFFDLRLNFIFEQVAGGHVKKLEEAEYLPQCENFLAAIIAGRKIVMKQRLLEISRLGCVGKPDFIRHRIDDWRGRKTAEMHDSFQDGVVSDLKH